MRATWRPRWLDQSAIAPETKNSAICFAWQCHEQETAKKRLWAVCVQSHPAVQQRLDVPGLGCAGDGIVLQHDPTVQTPGGTAALRIAAESIKTRLGTHTGIWLPNATWTNHLQVFAAAGLSPVMSFHPYLAPIGRGRLTDRFRMPS